MRLPAIRGKELARAIERLGFEHHHTRGSHMVYKHPDGRVTVIPDHPNETIGPGLLLKIIKKDLKITRDQFLDFIRT